MAILIQKAHEVEVQQITRGNPEYVDRVKLLEKEVSYYKDESGKAQAEVERLLEILREVETEKNDKDKKITELERWGWTNRTDACCSVNVTFSETRFHLF